MGIIVRLIAPALIIIVVGLLFIFIEIKNAKEYIKNINKEHITVRLPKAYLWVGGVEITFFVVFGVFAFYQPEVEYREWLWVLIGFFILLGASLVYGALVWKIEVFKDEDYFICRTIALRTHRVQYSDCHGYKLSDHEMILKTNKKTFRIDLNTTNFNFFLHMLIRHDVKEIIKRRPVKRK